MPEVNAKVFAPLHFNKNVQVLDNSIHSGYLLPLFNTKFSRAATMISKISARHLMARFDPDVVHETYYSEDEFRPRGALRVVTVHDLIHDRFPSMFVNSEGTTRPKKIAAMRADHVICVSRNTQNDLIELYGIPEEKTSVVHLGVDKHIFAAPKSKVKVHPRSFILYVGPRGGYKNFESLILAVASSTSLRKNFDIVCFGGEPFTSQEKSFFVKCGLRRDQIFQMHGGDDRLVQFYQQAEALVYPSIYEGFGIPPLEAMAAGCPVICSNSSSLPEVVGAAAELFDPSDIASLISALETVLGSPSRLEELSKLGLARCEFFDWEKCATETAAVYRGIV